MDHKDIANQTKNNEYNKKQTGGTLQIPLIEHTLFIPFQQLQHKIITDYNNQADG
ncbi:hypothetical protein D3C72_1415940 [compost metagenome]